jgi:hypothetical protein
MTNQEAVARLAALGREKGELSAAILAAADGILSAESYRRRFGSLVAAFELAGYQPEAQRRRMLTASQYRTRLADLAAELVDRINGLGGRAAVDPTCQGIKVNNACRIALGSARAQNSSRGQIRWRVHANRRAKAELTLVARMDASNAEITNYYLLPTADLSLPTLKMLRLSNSVFARACRFDSIEAFCRMCAGDRQ